MKEFLEKSMSHDQYMALTGRLVDEGRTTGPEQTESRIEFTKLNLFRMRRIEKTTVLSESLSAELRNNRKTMIWLVLTEAWCGDAAQSVPVIESISRGSALIETRYLLRDENPELMDRFLTNGARSIPKVIILDAESLEVLGEWGPRPEAGARYFAELRESGVGKDELLESMQRWYNDDRGRSVQSDFESMLKVINGAEISVAAF